MAEKQEVLKPSVGDVAAAVLIAEMPELRARDAKQAAAFAGLAPFNRDSGKSSKRASVRGGRPGVRCALYMAAVAAIRRNADIRNSTAACAPPETPLRPPSLRPPESVENWPLQRHNRRGP
jgi:transposase